MMQVEVSPSKMKTELHKVKEWSPLWSHENLRNNYQAFSLLCLYLEIIGELSPSADLSDPHLEVDDSMEGLFRVLSNAVYHLEARATEKKTDTKTELFIFITKLLVEQGVFPIREGCAFCDVELKNLSTIFLVPDHGGFSCDECIGHLDETSQVNKREGREVWELLGSVANQRYQDLMELKIQDTDALYSLLHYFNYQFHFHEKTFKSLKMVI